MSEREDSVFEWVLVNRQIKCIDFQSWRSLLYSFCSSETQISKMRWLYIWNIHFLFTKNNLTFGWTKKQVLKDRCPRSVCIQRSKLMNRLHQGTSALQEGDLVLKASLQFSKNTTLFSNRLTSCLVWEIYRAKSQTWSLERILRQSRQQFGKPCHWKCWNYFTNGN